MNSWPLSAGIVLLFAAGASAQVPRVLLREGDDVPGLNDPIESIAHVAVLDDGTWLAHVRTASFGDALLRDGQLELLLGTSLSPPGSFLAGIPELGVSRCGHLAGVLDVGGIAGVERGLFHDRTALRLEGETSPTLGVTYLDFYTSAVQSDDDFLVLARISDPAPPPGHYPVEHALIRIDADFDANDDGRCDDPRVLGERIVLRQNDALGNRSVLNFLTVPNMMGFDERGDSFCIVVFKHLAGTGFVVDGRVVAETGAPIPGSSETYGLMSLATADVDDAGAYALDTQNGDAFEVIVRSDPLSGQPVTFKQTGDAVPAALGPYHFVGLGDRNIYCTPVCYSPDPLMVVPALLTNGGDLLWFGEWDTPDTARDQALFVNERALIQKGITTVSSGATVVAFDRPEIRNHVQVSENGRYFACVAGLSPNDRHALLLVDLGEAVPYGCDPLALRLEHEAGDDGAGGLPLVGGTFRCTLPAGPAGTSLSGLAFATSPLPAYPCGRAFGFGELLLEPRTIQARILAGPPPQTFAVTLPPSSALVGAVYYAQAFCLHGGLPSAATNGIRFVFGTPQP